MAAERLEVALIHEVFFGGDGMERLQRRLRTARENGAELAVLPELPLQAWVPVSRTRREHDAEEPGGPIHSRLADAARNNGIGLLGGAIVREPATGLRRNRALLYDAKGRLVSHYDKLHVPLEEGFWEGEHYEAGERAPGRCDEFGLPVGLQICSDLNRPQGLFLLAATGVAAVLAPRATPPESYERWRTVIRTGAMIGATYVLSTNRPESERGVSIGGPSLAVAPDGEVLAESTDPVIPVTLERSRVERARADYPGYLDWRADLYARAWGEVARNRSPETGPS